MLPDKLAAMKTLNDLDDQIVSQLERIEAELRRNLSVKIAVDVDVNKVIAFGKIDGAWGLIIEHDGQREQLRRASRELRSRALVDGWIVKLIQAAPSLLDEQIKQRNNALASARGLLVALGVAEPWPIAMDFRTKDERAADDEAARAVAALGAGEGEAF